MSVAYQYSINLNVAKQKKISKKLLKTFKQLLIEERTKLLSPTQFQEDTDVEGDETDLVQGILIHSILEKLSARDKLKLDKIVSALDRISEGSFGKCEQCGEWIAEKRLLAMPECSICISCAEIKEKESKQHRL